MTTNTMNFGFEQIAVGTNINDIKVDPRLEQRASTGLPFVDMVASGKDTPAGERGFVPSEVILFTGGPGSGKSTLTLQMAAACTEVGHSVLFVGNEESSAQTRMTYKRLGLKAGFVIANPTFIDPPAGAPKDVVAAVGNNTLRTHFNALLERHKKAQAVKGAKKGHPIMIIDSLQTLNDGKWGLATSSKTPARVMNELCQMAKESYAIIIVIGHVGKGGDFKGENVLKHMVDGHLELVIDDEPESKTFGKRFLTMSKHRFGPCGVSTVLELTKKGLREVGSKSPK